MTLLDSPLLQFGAEADGPQRFIFDDVDRAFYESVGEKLAERRVFITYYKRKLEVVTVSLLHERITALLVLLVQVLAEETSMPISTAGMTTLKRTDLDIGVEPDNSFYTTHELQMRGKAELDLSVDPPPDLAIEVEITRRLGARKSIYRELGVPEVWVYSMKGLLVLVRTDNGYAELDRSPTFPFVPVQEITEFITIGLRGDQTALTRNFRRRVQQILAQGHP